MTNQKPSILFLEALLSGHHETYLANLARLAQQHGFRPLIAAAATEENRRSLERLQVEVPGAEIIPVPMPEMRRSGSGTLQQLIREFSFWRYMAQAYKQVAAQHRIEHVLLPYMDYCKFALALRGSPFGATPFSGIIMRATFHFHKMQVIAPKKRTDVLEHFLLWRLLGLASLRALYSIDETFFEFSRTKSGRRWKKVSLMRDPVELAGTMSREEARQHWGLGGELRTILLYGAVDTRKGIRQLLAAAFAPGMPSDIAVLVAGVRTPEVREWMTRDADLCEQKKRRRLLVIDKRVSDDEEQSLFAACDAVWLGYDGHYNMSGVLIKAVLAGKPILATEAGLIGWYCKNLPAATTFKVGSPAMIQAAIRGMFLDPALQSSEIARSHTWDDAGNAVFPRLR